MSGIYRRRVDLASGRFDMIDDGTGFALALEREIIRVAQWQPLGTREIVGYTVAIGAPLAFAWWLRKRDVWMNLIAAAWVVLLASIAVAVTTERGQPASGNEREQAQIHRLGQYCQPDE